MKVNLSLKMIGEWIGILLIFSVMAAVGNWVGYQYPFMESLFGMFILCFISLLGLIVEKLFPFDNVPAIIYISLIGIIVAIPGVPTADFLVHYVSQIELTTICTAFLAYVGIAIGNDWEEFKKIGWKGIVITLIVISGTYLCSAAIAHITLVATGMV